MRHRADGNAPGPVSRVTPQRQFAHSKNSRFGDGGGVGARHNPIVTSDGALPKRTTCASEVTNTPPSVGFPGVVFLLGGDCTELEELRDKEWAGKTTFD